MQRKEPGEGTSDYFDPNNLEINDESYNIANVMVRDLTLKDL